MSFDANVQSSFQIGRRGIRSAPTADDISAARAAFDAHHFIRLPQFLDDELLTHVQNSIGVTGFEPKTHAFSGHEMKMAHNDALFLLRFLLSGRDVMSLLGQMTGCAAITELVARIYRLDANSTQHHAWHDDVGYGRQFAISLNVGAAPFEGGALRIRETVGERIVGTVFNTTPGDAVLFRVSADLQHEVQPVTGNAPRTTFAGWFCEPSEEN